MSYRDGLVGESGSHSLSLGPWNPRKKLCAVEGGKMGTGNNLARSSLAS